MALTARPPARVLSFFFCVLVYCAKAGRAYVTHYYSMRRGVRRGSRILIKVDSDEHPSLGSFKGRLLDTSGYLPNFKTADGIF